ncbi:MAG: carbohydrate binding family 9 domain-containing protein, partial [Deltaproteobacteria bacterium]|nr:carbohydrate binding family 9 domain-containing protein [Deltaproteobacteria bacterium]
WHEVPLMPALIQQSPVFGAAASHPTEIRAAYADEGLYFAFFCHEHHGDVIAPFFPRDQLNASDMVWVEIDSNGDDTNGYLFGVTPSGAIFDGQLFRDTSEELLWDGVWQAAAKEVPGGWSAEIFVPWSTLRFERRKTNTIGLNFARIVNDQQETARLSFVPQGVPARVSEAIDWAGIEDIEGGLNLEIQPYVSGRFVLQRPPGSLDRSWRALPNAGFDLKYGITGDLTLDVAVNPDFGQAEVDAAVLNLGPFEVFFPEKRRFFLESKEIFETRFPLFYSRRIGNNPSPGRAQTTSRRVYGQIEEGELVELDPLTRVLGSVRLTGQLAPNWVIGVLSATTGPSWGIERFSDGSEQRIPVDPLSSWSVVRLRRHFDPQTWIGGIVTNVARAGSGDEAFTGGFDYNINFRKRWIHGTQVIGTHDGRKAGMGVDTSLSRSGRRTFWGVGGEMLTPNANFNDLGFMTRTNYITGYTDFAVFNAQPIGRVRELSASANAALSTSFSGQILEKRFGMDYALETLGLWRISAFFGGHLPQLDLFETRGNIPWEVPIHWWTGMRLSTPRNKRVAGSIGGNYGEQKGKPGPDVYADIAIRPIDRLQFVLGTTWNGSFGRPRWVAEREIDEQPIFARARIMTLNTNLRITLAITPQVSLTSFNQLFYSTAHHTSFYELADPQTLIPIAPDPWYGEVDRGFTSLISNTILRWEYLPGSFLFVAYTHRSALSERGEPLVWRFVEQFTNLGARAAEHEDVLFIKLGYLFGL